MLSFVWAKRIGYLRASLASLARLLWLLPIFLAFFPRLETIELPRSMHLKPINILVDDSISMKESKHQALVKAQELIKYIKQECLRLGCRVKVKKLSEISSMTEKGFTPLGSVFNSWYGKLDNTAWLLLSDGGDAQPTVSWDEKIDKKYDQNSN